MSPLQRGQCAVLHFSAVISSLLGLPETLQINNSLVNRTGVPGLTRIHDYSRDTWFDTRRPYVGQRPMPIILHIRAQAPG
jgi:hypothetical protein